MKPNGVKRDGGLKMGGTYWYYVSLSPDYISLYLKH